MADKIPVREMTHACLECDLFSHTFLLVAFWSLIITSQRNDLISVTLDFVWKVMRNLDNMSEQEMDKAKGDVRCIWKATHASPCVYHCCLEIFLSVSLSALTVMLTWNASVHYKPILHFYKPSYSNQNAADNLQRLQ